MNKGLRLFYRGSGISFADDDKMEWKGLGCFSSTLCGTMDTFCTKCHCTKTVPVAPSPHCWGLGAPSPGS